MRILVIGAGAIGCLLGGKLAQASNTVTLVGRTAFAESVRLHGLQLTDERGEHTIQNVRAVASLADAYDESNLFYDLAILSVKSYDTANAIAELVAVTPPEGLPAVLSMQNGVGNEEAIAQYVDPASIIAGTLTTPVSVLAPGQIRVDRPSYTLALSPWTKQVSTTLFDATHHAFTAAGFSVHNYQRAEGLKWAKLLLNMVGNATSAILDQVPAELYADARILDVELAAWREAFAVMHAARILPINLNGYPLAPLGMLINVTPNAVLRPILRRQASRGRGSKAPSLLLDLRSGKTRSEIDYLNGAIVSYGERLDVPTPINRVLTEIYRRLLENPKERDSWRNQPDQLVRAIEAAHNTRQRQPMPS